MFRKFFLGLVLAFSFGTALADNTPASGQEITKFRYDGSGKNVYFETSGKWDAQACDATYVWIHSTLPGREEMLSIGLAAKMAGKKVQFFGECHSDPAYFKAHYIIVL